MTPHIKGTQFILYVHDQDLSSRFYRNLLRKEPELEVPGMTEFELADHCKLGLMPTKGIARILGEKSLHPDHGQGIPRCELYWLVADASFECAHAQSIGALLLSPLSDRDWGHRVGYFSDPDGHIIAFAEPIIQQS